MDNNKTFFGLGIAPAILEVISGIGLKTPTPIQEQSIPVAIEGKDLMGIAQTGTGKTLAFGIPMLNQVIRGGGPGLIIVPTRELAIQVRESLDRIARPLHVRMAVLIGGEAIGRQVRDLRSHPQIVVGTPGRIIDHLEQKTIRLEETKILVIDEADRMLDMGFAPQLRRIYSAMTNNKQTMLFSATMPEEIVSMAKAYMKLPVRVEIARQGSTAKDVTQELFFVPQEAKSILLEKLLKEYKGSVLIFSRTKHGAKRIVLKIRSMKETAAEIHSERSLGQRKEALQGFKTGKYRILVATDIAARGIDVTNIELVINYDLPQNAEDYVHRIGRTGRAGGKGHAISFARPNQRGDVRAIEKLIRLTLPVSKLPGLPVVVPGEITDGHSRPFKRHHNNRNFRPNRSRTRNFNRKRFWGKG